MTFTSFPNGFNCKANVFLFFFVFFFYLRNLLITISFFKLRFFKKKQIPTYPDKIHDRGNYTIDRDATQCSVFSVLEKSTTTDTMLHLRNKCIWVNSCYRQPSIFSLFSSILFSCLTIIIT